jgi:hypothetical protein
MIRAVPTLSKGPTVKARALASVLLVTSTLSAHAQSPAATMSCRQYLEADRNTPAGVLGSLETDDAEANASLAEMGERIRTVCSGNPRMTLNEAMMKAIEEMD